MHTMFRNLIYSIKEAFKNLWRNGMMSVASISSVMATLLILGIIFIIIININSFVESAQDEFEEITLYLKEDLDTEGTEKLIEDIETVVGVREVIYLSKEEALGKMREDWGDNAYLLDGLDENPLPNSIIVTLRNLASADSVVEIIKNYDGVEDIKFHKDVIEKIMSISSFIRTIGLALILVLLAISTFIIANTIKLAVNARRREINIMKYVGATHWFIRRPFLIEGTILGMIGALLSAGIIFALYNYVFNYFTNQFYILFAAHFVPLTSVMTDLLIIFLVLGIGVGALGSINAMRKHLNV